MKRIVKYLQVVIVISLITFIFFTYNHPDFILWVSIVSCIFFSALLYQLIVINTILEQEMHINDSLETISRGVVVYSDPFRKEYTVQALLKSKVAVDMALVDMKGNVVMKKKFINPTGYFEGNISLESFSSGIYDLNLVSGSCLFTHRLVKR